MDSVITISSDSENEENRSSASEVSESTSARSLSKDMRSVFPKEIPVLVTKRSDPEVEYPSVSRMIQDLDDAKHFGVSNDSKDCSDGGSTISEKKSQVDLKESEIAEEEANSSCIFNLFLETCASLMIDKEKKGYILESLRQQYQLADNEFVDSESFIGRISKYTQKLLKSNKQVFIFLNDVLTLLRKNHTSRKRARLDILDCKECTNSKVPKVPSTSQGVCSNESVASEKESKYVIRLEKYLERLSKEIKRLQAHELTLEELGEEDSSYVQENLLKRKFVKVFEHLCKIKKVKPKTGRLIEKPIKVETCRFPEINKKIEGFINKSPFPDMCDINRLVEEVNQQNNLNLTNAQMKQISEDIFKEAGEQLQKRRHFDFVYNFGCYLTDVEKEDPADNDPLLNQKLQENRKTAKNALNNVIEKFSQKQTDQSSAGLCDQSFDNDAKEHSKSNSDSTDIEKSDDDLSLSLDLDEV